jgi:L-threonylcarbamoyladenylate synthase
MTRHYAPKATLTLYEGDPSLVVRTMGADARTAVAQGATVGILAPEDDLKALAPVLAAVASGGRVEVRPYGSRTDVERAGRELFAALRDLDAMGVSVILASSVGTDGLGLAIRDRLARAADGRIRTL